MIFILKGDTANKIGTNLLICSKYFQCTNFWMNLSIGTYQLAILAKYHNVPFYVAVPTTR